MQCAPIFFEFLKITRLVIIRQHCLWAAISQYLLQLIDSGQVGDGHSHGCGY
jgi:hypothetical protein